MSHDLALGVLHVEPGFLGSRLERKVHHGLNACALEEGRIALAPVLNGVDELKILIPAKGDAGIALRRIPAAARPSEELTGNIDCLQA